MSEPLNLSGRDQSPEKIVNPAMKSSRVERLQQKLYSPNAHFEMKPRQELREKEFLYEKGWEKGNKNDFAGSVETQKLSVFAKLAIVAFIFFIGALSYVYFIFSGNSGNVAGSNVDVKVISPVSVGGGEELVLDVIVENKNSIPIYTVDLVIEYPDGTKAVPDLRTNLPRMRDGLGDIMPGQIVKQSYSAALFGEEGDSKEVTVRVEYGLAGSTAIFEQEKKVSVALQSAPIRLLVNAVKEITAQQELVFDVTLTSNSNQDLRNVVVDVQYPFGFTVTEATRAPSDRNNVWRFDLLKPQEEITFQVKGRLEGQNNEERVFTWNAGISDEVNPNQIGVAFTKIQKAVSITQPFLALNLAIDGDTSADIVRPGTAELEGRLTYVNNTGAAINDARIVLKLDGDVLNDASVQVGNGFYNSTDNTVTWDASTRPELRQIPVGGRETLLFRFASKPLATRSAVFKNPEVIMDARVTGRRLAEDNVPENVESQTVTRVKFVSTTVLTALTSRGTSPFLDTGPLPPRVEQETTYTVTLSLTNSSNLLSGGKVTATLPNYVRWNNQVSPGTERLSFDPVTRRVEWDLGNVVEHAGFIDPARKVAMQLTLVPSVSQAGATPTLLNDLLFEGLDTFTNTQTTTAPREMPNIDMGLVGGQESSKVVE
jgi:hypothetical protein